MKLEKLSNVLADQITGEWGDEGEDVAVLRTTNFTNEGRLNLTEVVRRSISKEKIVKKRLIRGDTIIEKSGGSPTQPVGRVVYFDVNGQDYLCNNFTSILRPSKAVDPRYFFWFLFANHISKRTLKYQNKTTGIINLKLERYLQETEIPLPLLPVQKKVAGILDKADNLRQKDKQLLKQYNKLADSIFYDMFGYNEVLESKYKKTPLSSIAEVVSGVTLNSKNVKQEWDSYPYLRVFNVQDGFFDLSEIKYVKASKSEFDKYVLKANDILVTEGGDPDKLGRGSIWRNEVENCIHQNHVFRIRLSSKDFNAVFLSSLLGSTYGKKYFLKAAKQTTGIASINSTQLKAFPVVMPDLTFQNKFATTIQKALSGRDKIKTNVHQSEALFQSLLQKAFKGELVKAL